PVVGRHRTMSGPVPVSRPWSKILVQPLRFRFYLIPFLSYNYFRFTGRHCYFWLSAECRPTTDNVGDSSSVLGVVENVLYPLKSRRYLMPFPSYYYFRFIGRHCYFRMSADIGQCRDQFQ